MFRITKVRIILLTIVCMGFLSACDPSPKPFSVVLQVAAVGDKVYAYTVDRWSWGPGCCAYGEPVFYYSEDGGQSWSKTDTVPSAMEKKLSEAKSRISRSGNSGVDGLGRVLDSDDGGKTWREDIAVAPP